MPGKKAAPKTHKPSPVPSREEVLAYIADNPTAMSKRDIVRAFNIRGGGKIALKAMLRDLAAEGLIEKHAGRKISAPDRLPPVGVISLVDRDKDGHFLAHFQGTTEVEKARIVLLPSKRDKFPLKLGDRILARLELSPDGDYVARVIRKLENQGQSMLGVVQEGPNGLIIQGVERKNRKAHPLALGKGEPPKVGALVRADLLPARRGRAMAPREAQVIESFADITDARAFSLISIFGNDIPHVFPEAVLQEAERTSREPLVLGARDDLTSIPLVTIDGADARDFDDAVWAVADDSADNPGGWKLLVAIADVAHYVRPGSPLDQEALKRGNSVYFPDRVVPMLPEALSNGACSLKPDEPRYCLAVEMTIAADGKALKHRFRRGFMRSQARLTYEQVEAAHLGEKTPIPQRVVEEVLPPLYGAYQALQRERERRGTLEFDLPERKVTLDDQGKVLSITRRLRLDSHKLIEEFMIAANVAAARSLGERKVMCMYRNHEAPDAAKIAALDTVLKSFGLTFSRGQGVTPKALNTLLNKVAGTDAAPLVNDLVLRAQSLAVYGPRNLGHFGLALGNYAHFTSPIRRYSDLLVHRGLIAAYKLGDGGHAEDDIERFERIGQAISETEQRAAQSERETLDRYVARYMSDHVGAIFEGRIRGVTRAGLFVALLETGAEGLLPMSLLPDDRYDFDERHHRIVGRRWGRSYQLGQAMAVRLVEAEPAAGSMIFEPVEGEKDKAQKGQHPSSGAMRRPSRPSKPKNRGKKRR